MLEAFRTIAMVWFALAVTYAIIAAFLIGTRWILSVIRRPKTRTIPADKGRPPE
jgi:hypothetical protein